MKQITLLLTIVLLSFTTIFANDASDLVGAVTSTASEVIDSAKSNISSGVATVKNGVTDGVNIIDTSGNFAAIYNDLKDGVVALGSALKVGTEHVYTVLVKQQVVNAVVYLTLGILSLIFLLVTYKQWGKIEVDDQTDEIKGARPIALTIIFGLMSVACFAFFIFNIHDVAMGLLNPEYGAMKDVIEFVQGVSSGSGSSGGSCNTCH